MVGKLLTPCHYTRGEVLVPQTKGGDDEVVESTDETSHEQGLGLAASLGTRHEHLGGGSGFGEGIFAVHILDEILAERYEEEDAEDTTQRRSDEYAQEVGLEVKHIDGGHHKDGSGYHSTRTGSDTLDDNILAHGVAALGGRRQTDGDDGDRDGGLEYLTDLQSQIGGSSREQYYHQQSPRHTPCCDFGNGLFGTHNGLVLLAVVKFTKSVVGQLHRVFLFFCHCSIY